MKQADISRRRPTGRNARKFCQLGGTVMLAGLATMIQPARAQTVSASAQSPQPSLSSKPTTAHPLPSRTHKKYTKSRGPKSGVYYLDRNEDDYSYLIDPSKQRSWSDALKHINLDPSGDVYLTLNGEIRLRFDSLANKNLGIASSRSSRGIYKFTNARDIRTLYSRIEFGTALNLQDWGTIYLEMYDGQETGKNIGTTLQGFQETELTFGQAYLELHDNSQPTHFGARLGRQFFYFGNGLQLSPNYSTDVPVPTYDAARLFVDAGWFRADAFYGATIDYANGGLNASVQSGSDLWGLYASGDLPAFTLAGLPAATTIDAFYLGYQNEPLAALRNGAYDDDVFISRTGQISAGGLDTRHTFGLRFSGKLDALDFDWQGAVQLGADSGYTAQAGAFNTDTSYTLSQPGTPRLGLRFNMATGGADNASHVISTYQPMVAALNYYSENTTIAPTNLWNVAPHIGFKPLPSVSLTAYDGFYWRYSTDDAVYAGTWEGGEGPNSLATSIYNHASYIGQQPALLAKWQIDRNLALSAIAAYFIAGPAITEAGGKNTAYFRVVGDFMF